MIQTLMLVVLTVPAAPVPEPTPEVLKLQEKRVKVLKSTMKIRMDSFMNGRGRLDDVLRVAVHLRDAELEAATKPAQRVAAHLTYFKSSMEIDASCSARFGQGRMGVDDVYEARAARLKAEIDLRKAGGKLPRGVESGVDLKTP